MTKNGFETWKIIVKIFTSVLKRSINRETHVFAEMIGLVVAKVFCQPDYGYTQ